MYLLKVSEKFSAAHRIDGYNGDCNRLHGHNWEIKLTVEKQELDKIGLAYDLKTLKEDLRKVIKILDHTLLNDIPDFVGINPTAENIGKFIFGKLQDVLPESVSIKSVEVCESENSSVIYVDDETL
ncbi:6-carboxytetrahydropterin synthase QueD [bacterium]|nr:6-carboxytetrahydropterin synthase QueD [bacterium]